MSQKNETPVLIVSLLVTALLLGLGFWWFTKQSNLGGTLPNSSQTNSPNSSSPPDSSNPPNSSNPPTNPQTVSLDQRLSLGDRLLIATDASPQKQAAIQAIASKNYAQAVTNLEAALAQKRNDPEALIYLNNARIGDQKAYSIAVAVPTATAANSALEILRGVAQAQTEVNQAGGINGVPLKVLIASDDNDPNTAAQIATTLVNTDSVLGVIGHFGSDATLAAAPVYQQGGLVMISPTSTSIQLSGLGDYVFRTVPSDRFTAAVLANHMLSTLQKGKAAVFFNSGSGYSKSLKDEFTTAVFSDGGQVVSEVDLAAPGFDAGSAVQQAMQQGSDVLVLAANTATLDAALQVVAVNRQRLPILGGDSLYNPKLLQIGGETAAGMVVAVPWDLLSDPQAPFARESRQLWGGDVNWRTAMSYDAARVLIAGLQADPSRVGIEQTLRSPGFSVDGATGAVRFLPSGDRNQAAQLVEVRAGNRTGYGYDFYPVGK